eukprot:1797704-Pyramimonas_sp.AAC.1
MERDDLRHLWSKVRISCVFEDVAEYVAFICLSGELLIDWINTATTTGDRDLDALCVIRPGLRLVSNIVGIQGRSRTRYMGTKRRGKGDV